MTSVLSILGKFDVTENDFPKLLSTFCKLVRQKVNMVSSRKVGEENIKHYISLACYDNWLTHFSDNLSFLPMSVHHTHMYMLQKCLRQ